MVGPAVELHLRLAMKRCGRTLELGWCSRNIFKSFLSAPSLVVKDVRRLRKPHTSRMNISTSPFLCIRNVLLNHQPQPTQAAQKHLTVPILSCTMVGVIRIGGQHGIGQCQRTAQRRP